MKLRCRLGFCNDLRREIHITEMMPKNASAVKAAVIHKCNKCGCTKMKTGRPMDTITVIPERYLYNEANAKREAKIVADAAIEKMKG